MGPIAIPSGRYNAAQELLTRNLAARAGKAAFIDADGAHTYAEVAERAGRVGAALLAQGLAPGDRVALALLDGVDFVTAFLGAMRVGLIPIPLNTLMPASDFAYVLDDSGARVALVSEPLAATLVQAIEQAAWPGRMFVAGEGAGLAELLALASGEAAPHDSDAEDIAFWIYSSGSTGRPKGAQHRHRSLPATAELFSRQVLGVAQDDVLFSAGKLFFAYGLGNSLTFPMYAGATAVLFPGRVTPDVAVELLARHGVTIFCGAPTLFASMLASGLVGSPSPALRLCTSAGDGPAGRGRPRLDAGDRGRDRRRHRLDRDAAHLPRQPAGRGALRRDRPPGPGLRGPPRRRRRRRGGAGRPRRALGPGAFDDRRLLEPT
jgi:benzoate-CoA ligase